MTMIMMMTTVDSFDDEWWRLWWVWLWYICVQIFIHLLIHQCIVSKKNSHLNYDFLQTATTRYRIYLHRRRSWSTTPRSPLSLPTAEYPLMYYTTACPMPLSRYPLYVKWRDGGDIDVEMVIKMKRWWWRNRLVTTTIELEILILTHQLSARWNGR